MKPANLMHSTAPGRSYLKQSRIVRRTENGTICAVGARVPHVVSAVNSITAYETSVRTLRTCTIIKKFPNLAMFGVVPHWLQVDGKGVTAIKYLRSFLFDLTTGSQNIWHQPEALVSKTWVVVRPHPKIREIDQLRANQTLSIDHVSNLPWKCEKADWGTLRALGLSFLALGQALPLRRCRSLTGCTSCHDGKR